MRKQNYRQAKKQKEEARKARQSEKQQRRHTGVPGAASAEDGEADTTPANRSDAAAQEPQG